MYKCVYECYNELWSWNICRILWMRRVKKKKFFFILASIQCVLWVETFLLRCNSSFYYRRWTANSTKKIILFLTQWIALLLGTFLPFFFSFTCVWKPCYLQIQMKISRKCMCEKLFFSIILPRSRIDNNNNNNNKSNNIKKV